MKKNTKTAKTVKTVKTVKFTGSLKTITKAWNDFQGGYADARKGFHLFLSASLIGLTGESKKSDIMKALPELDAKFKMKIQNFIYSWCAIDKKGKLILLSEATRKGSTTSTTTKNVEFSTLSKFEQIRKQINNNKELNKKQVIKALGALEVLADLMGWK